LNSRTTERFRKIYKKLPKQIKKQAVKVYKLWQEKPTYNSLHFKKIYRDKEYYSLRIGLDWRVLGVMDGDTIIWFWIGSHEDYNNLLKQL